MKKILVIILVLTLVLGTLSSCATEPEKPATATAKTNEIQEDDMNEPHEAVPCSVATVVMPSEKADPKVQKLITDVLGYTDKKSLAGAEVNASKDTASSCLAAIRRAVDGGAHVVVLPSSSSGEALAKASINYPDIRFVAVYGTLADAPDVDFTVKKNTVLLSLSNEVGGYLAGVCAVYEGNTRLAVLAQKSSESTNSYILGFIQGAEAAAEKLPLGDASVSVTVCYTIEDATADIKAAELYNEADIIFACGKSTTEAAYQAATRVGKQVIGTDGDYSSYGDAMLTYITSDIAPAVTDILSKADNNSEWVKLAGKQDYYSMLPDGSPAIGLADDFDRFSVFNRTEYTSAISAASNGLVKSVNITSISGYPAVSDITSVLHLSKLNLAISAPQVTADTKPTTATATE